MTSAKYPKAVLDALERDQGVRFKGCYGGNQPDARFCYGATCTWFGSIHETKQTPAGLPGCPYCGGLLFEMVHEGKWWELVDGFERNGHPRYRAMWEWQRGQGKCFSLREGLSGLIFAYKDATGMEVSA